MRLQLPQFVAAALLLTFTAGAPLLAEDEVELHAAMIHSDVPLWGTSDKTWPQGFSNNDGWGCIQRVKVGHWRYDGNGAKPWWRLENYGAFHCALIEHRGYERAELDKGFDAYSFLIDLGMETVNGQEVRLWALQSGTAPGSNYTLLSEIPSEGLIGAFLVLQSECPPGYTRRGPEHDIWNTEYCAINSQQELTRMARKMAARPPLGTLTFVGPAITDDATPVDDDAVEQGVLDALEKLEIAD